MSLKLTVVAKVYGVSTLYLVITNGAVLIRLVSQWRSSQRLFIDDWLLIVAVVSFSTTGLFIQICLFKQQLIVDVLNAIYIWGRMQNTALLGYGVPLTNAQLALISVLDSTLIELLLSLAQQQW